MSDKEFLPEDLPDKLYFRIGEVASLVGVEPHVLRYWESEFSFKTLRSVSGQRLYRKQDIARFLKVKNLLHDKGFTVAGARKLLRGGKEPQTAVDPGVVRDALERVEAIRNRLAILKEETRPEWD